MTIFSPIKTADVRSRIEPELKDSATAVLEKMGLNISQAFRLFLRQVWSLCSPRPCSAGTALGGGFSGASSLDPAGLEFQ